MLVARRLFDVPAGDHNNVCTVCAGLCPSSLVSLATTSCSGALARTRITMFDVRKCQIWVRSIKTDKPRDVRVARAEGLQ